MDVCLSSPKVAPEFYRASKDAILLYEAVFPVKAIDGADGFQNSHQMQQFESAKFSIDQNLSGDTPSRRYGSRGNIRDNVALLVDLIRAIFTDTPLRKECIRTISNVSPY
ncbi:unnamed protein product [Linum tenue]|uniref:Uncharacterized protein n=1 Tax=Linum tenue TaxID=586396 RepID=A0AAV0HYQ7_9ROSI|nr:unnamed protein product [Linum tenue]